MKISEWVEYFDSPEDEQRLSDYAEFVNDMLVVFDIDSEDMRYPSLGLAGEAGEVIEHIKKYYYHNNKAISYEAIVKELGDVRFYYQLLLNQLGISDRFVVNKNMEKLLERHKERD
jgi:hypothetical protein|tara:strand:- start:1452 stop:1799 length:348 start_codon:yes stop_codon:yes gene_type:complete